MSEMAGFGPGAWLPRTVQLAWRLEAQEEQRQARQAEAERAARAEARRSADLTLAAAMAAARGEVADPVAVASGRITGRTALDVLREAGAAADRQDARAEFEARRDRGEQLNLMGELEPPATRSAPTTATARAAERTDEKFRASVAAASEARRRRSELERMMPQLREPIERKRHTSSRAQGFGPMNVPGSQVSGWLARGWRP